MSTRRLTAAAVASVALIAAPATASARPADHPQVTRPAAVVTNAVPYTTEARNLIPADSGAGTLTVLAIAAGALLVGGATGFEGGRVVTRRGAVRP